MRIVHISCFSLAVALFTGCGGSNSGASDSSSSLSSQSSSVSSSVSSSHSSVAPIPDVTPISVATDRWFIVANESSGLVMDIAGASSELGGALIQASRSDSENQQFRFISSGDNYYRLIPRHSGLALDLYDFNTEDNADVVQWDDLNGVNQQFQLLSLANGSVQLTNRLSGKVLAPVDHASQEGARITQYSRSGELGQQWRLVDFAAYNPNNGGASGECGSAEAKARVTGTPGNYQMNGRSFGNDYRGAIFAALDALTPGRSQQERVTVMASGDVGDARINLKSNTIFEVCGTMNVAEASRGTITIWGSSTENISIPHLNITGTPSFAMLIADTRNLYLGQIDLRLNGGGGIRFDNRGATYDVKIDRIYVEGSSGHGVETWNIDGLEIGTVIARNTGYAGLLLNNTRNARIGTVDGVNTGGTTGYATLRFANTNGKVGNDWPTNIYVDKLISRGGARGFFCVSQSGGFEINSIDLADNGNNSVLIENCYNGKINGGTVNGGGEFRLSARAEFANNRDLTISNVSVSNTSVRESPCGENVQWNNLSVSNGARNTCN